MVGRQPDAAVYFYAGTGLVTGGYLAAPAKIGNFGWDAFNMLVNVHDFNGDGKNDLIARKPDGTLWFYPGTGTGGYGPAVRIGTSAGTPSTPWSVSAISTAMPRTT